MLDSDYKCLQYYGGVQTNCSTKILHYNDNGSLPIMNISSYYDKDEFKSPINTKQQLDLAY